MNGAESILRTFLGSGVEVCFVNPGTSEMHLVQALDGVSEMRVVLALFEGVCTGAADGYGRMKGSPAATLLHLGAGLANGIANLHNARRASSPLINVVGNHAAYHLPYDTPLTSNIETLAKNFSSWYKESSTAQTIAQDGADAVTAALTAKPGSQGQISTLVLPVDACWGESPGPVPPNPFPIRASVADKAIEAAAQTLDEHSALLLNGPALLEEGLKAARRIAAVSGCKLLSVGFPARLEGGPGQTALSRLPYFPEQIQQALRGFKKLVLVGSQPPATMFAYPNTPGYMVPDNCELSTLAKTEEDVVGALQSLADALKAPTDSGPRHPYNRPNLPSGQLNPDKIAATIAAVMPENLIFSLDSGGGRVCFAPVQQAAPHTWLNITGGAIGQGGPVAVGAAVAAPDRRLVALVGDGGGMYTNQAFWTQAREGLDVTTIIYSNRSYGILETEYWRLGVNEVGARAANMFSLQNPDIDWVSLGKSMGIPGSSVATVDELADHLQRSFSQDGPYLIEALY